MQSYLSFILNPFNEFAEFSDKDICPSVKGPEAATYCVRDNDATTASAGHMRETGSLN